VYTLTVAFKNSEFCPHSVFVCFYSLRTKLTIIALNGINELDFIMEMEFVLSEVGLNFCIQFR